MRDIFTHLLVLGRPACGKSEFIDFLKHAPAPRRRVPRALTPVRSLRVRAVFCMAVTEDRSMWLAQITSENPCWRNTSVGVA